MQGNWTHAFFPALTKIVTRGFYELVSYLDRDEHLIFMNYGYVAIQGGDRGPVLLPHEEKHRYQIQLYDHIARAGDWPGKVALEVGSGRGGGAAYIKRKLKPQSLTGVDFSKRAVRFCKKYYSHYHGLDFVQGDAESLQFSDAFFDVVLNVESSLYYPNVPAFLRSVFRVLKPGGIFLYADIRYFEELPMWRQQLLSAGFELLSEEDITQNTRTALALDQDHRRKLIDEYVPRFLHPPFNKFAGTKPRLAQGTPRAGQRVYLNFVLKKPTD